MKKNVPAQQANEEEVFLRPDMEIGTGSNRIMRGNSGESKLFFIFRIAFLVALVAFGVWAQNNLIISRSYVFTSQKLPKTFVGYKIAQVSDLHNTNLNVINNIKAAKPNIILVTGGFADDNGKYNKSVKTLNQLGNIAPTYFVLGHNDEDYRDGILSGVTSNNVRFIENDTTLIQAPQVNESAFIKKYLGNRLVSRAEKGDEAASSYLEYTKLKLEEDAEKSIAISGFENGLLRMDYTELMNYVYGIIGTDKELFQVTACNQAQMFERLSNADIDMVFSGETHGQKGIAGDYSHGVYALNGTTLFLSAGVGNLSGYKQRIFNFPDVLIVTLSDGTIKDETPLEKLLGYFIFNVSTKFDNDGGFKEYTYSYSGGRRDYWS